MRSQTDHRIRGPDARALVRATSGGILAALLVLAIYLPARENGFVWDDWTVLDVFNSSGLRDPGSWREMLVRPPADYAVLFRPLTMLTILLQLWAGHTGPQPFHIVNLVIHSANVFLLTVIAWRLLENGASSASARFVLATACGMVYGLHPALTEPVIWISARSDLLLTFVLCLALLLDRALPEAGWTKAVAVATCFYLATLAKETAVGFLAALPIIHLATHWQRQGPLTPGVLTGVLLPQRRTYAALLTAFTLYVATRMAVVGPALGLDNVISPARYIDTFGQHMLVVAASMAQHVWSAIWPFQNMVPGRQMPLPISFMDVLPMVAASTAAIAIAVAAACTSHAGRAPALLFLAFVAALLPVANIVPIPAVVVPTEIVVTTRYLTFPLVFACLAVPFLVPLAVALLKRHVRCARALVGMIAAAWLLASAANVRVTIPLWKDDVVLNTWALSQGGASFWRHANIGAYFLLAGDYGRAREAFATSVRLRDDDQSAWVWNNLGTAEAALGNAGEAMRAFRRALELSSDEMRSRINIGRLERSTGNAQAAVDMLEQGLHRMQASGRRYPQEAELRYELALAYVALGRSTDAAGQLNAARSRARSSREREVIEGALRLIALR